MTIALALEYIKRRTELQDSTIQFRHFVLQPKERIMVQANQQLFVLVDPSPVVSVKSDFGIYDLSATAVNEMHYEHQGKIRLRNNAATTQHIQFIQVIPKENILCL
jgi:hypothetical protein